MVRVVPKRNRLDGGGYWDKKLIQLALDWEFIGIGIQGGSQGKNIAVLSWKIII